MKSILVAFDRCQQRQLFCVGYAWNDPVHGRQEGHTVVESFTEDKAMKQLLDRHPQVECAWIIK